MKTTFPLSDVDRLGPEMFGGKAVALAELHKAGFKVPATLCISSEAYRLFVEQEGLQEKIQLELHRKNFNDMRWEEIWDAALRIRNLFLHTEVPAKLAREITEAAVQHFDDTPVVIRSSAPDEDAAATSFAGLHESFVNIRGAGQILKHIKRVWASLWSDRALLYRRELGLDTAKSSMAVVVQALATGEVSGVAFSLDPTDTTQGIVEAVYGLNQGLVDGEVEPDRWFLKRKGATVMEHHVPNRSQYMIPAGAGVRLVELPAERAGQAPLSSTDVQAVYGMAKRLEEVFGKPQDVEWTKMGSEFVILQSRPVTARQDDTDDKRGWYLSLHRSYENLKSLRSKIETEHFPAMIREADELAAIDLTSMAERELAAEIARRLEIKAKWTGIYWDDFIPFAHGMRLFGKFYNDTVSPQDPFQFVELLAQAPLLSVARNRALRKIADHVSGKPDLQRRLASGGLNDLPDFDLARLMDDFVRHYGDPFCGTYGDKACADSKNGLVNVILQLADESLTGPATPKSSVESREVLEKQFLDKFADRESRGRAEDLLDLARASYRLRDDDNILLGRIEEQYIAALQEARSRLGKRYGREAAGLSAEELMAALEDSAYQITHKAGQEDVPQEASPAVRARQLRGQPAGPGIGRGRARVILSPEDLALFKRGEVLVCDAVDPNMTFIVPLTAGVVERRGGMLIHGAIIAREYGIACVTGVPGAASLIHTGDEVTVDGYLGIVTVGHPGRENQQHGGKHEN